MAIKLSSVIAPLVFVALLTVVSPAQAGFKFGHGFHGHGFKGGHFGGRFGFGHGFHGFGHRGFHRGFHHPYGFSHGFGGYHGFRGPSIVAVPSSPPVYIEQGSGQTAAQQAYYWYYCSSPEGYYPYVKACPRGWRQVVPQPPPRP
ncbi:MAG: hypothetical protein ACHBNF_18480 [Chromatiales bacterium]